MNEPYPNDAYITLSTLITAIGAAYACYGTLNVLEGVDKDVPSVKNLGERQLKMGGNLVILAAYIREGTLPPPEIIEYMANR